MGWKDCQNYMYFKHMDCVEGKINYSDQIKLIYQHIALCIIMKQ